MAVRNDYPDVGNLDNYADRELENAHKEGKLVVVEFPRVVERILHHVEGLVKLVCHEHVHNDHGYDSRDAKLYR